MSAEPTLPVSQPKSRNELKRLRNIADELSQQHFELGGEHADVGVRNCSCKLAQCFQKADAEWQSEYDKPDISLATRAAQAEVKLAERDRELQQARGELDRKEECLIAMGESNAENFREKNEALEEIARLKAALTKAHEWAAGFPLESALAGSADLNAAEDVYKACESALHPVPEKPKS